MRKHLHDRLFNFEAMPSAGLWNKIARSLDDDTEYSLAKRMLQYEAPPPSYGWETVLEQLDQDNKTVVPFSKNYSFIKYASVAAVFIVCIIGTFLYTSKKQDADQLSSAKKERSLLQAPPLANPAASINSDQSIEVDRDKAGYVIPASRARESYSIRLHPLPSRKHSFIKNKLSTKLPAKKPLVSSELLERYIVFSKTTGEAVRLSKKLFGLFACSEWDIDCEEDIRSVQQKMASGTMMASTDFTGMLEALQTMNTEHNN